MAALLTRCATTGDAFVLGTGVAFTADDPVIELLGPDAGRLSLIFNPANAAADPPQVLLSALDAVMKHAVPFASNTWDLHAVTTVVSPAGVERFVAQVVPALPESSRDYDALIDATARAAAAASFVLSAEDLMPCEPYPDLADAVAEWTSPALRAELARLGVDFAAGASQDTLKLRLAAALPDHLPWGLPLGALLRPTDAASLRQGGLLGFLAAMHAGGLGTVAARTAATRSATFASDPCARFLAAARAFADAASALEPDDTPEVVVETFVQLLAIQQGFLRHPANPASVRRELAFFRHLAAGADPAQRELALRRRTFLRLGRMGNFPRCVALALGLDDDACAALLSDITAPGASSFPEGWATADLLSLEETLANPSFAEVADAPPARRGEALLQAERRHREALASDAANAALAAAASASLAGAAAAASAAGAGAPTHAVRGLRAAEVAHLTSLFKDPLTRDIPESSAACLWAAASFADGTLVKACRLHPTQLAALRGACPLVTRVASQQGLFDQALAQLTVLAPFLELGGPLDESLLSIPADSFPPGLCDGNFGRSLRSGNLKLDAPWLLEFLASAFACATSCDVYLGDGTFASHPFVARLLDDHLSVFLYVLGFDVGCATEGLGAVQQLAARLLFEDPDRSAAGPGAAAASRVNELMVMLVDHLRFELHNVDFGLRASALDGSAAPLPVVPKQSDFEYFIVSANASLDSAQSQRVAARLEGRRPTAATTLVTARAAARPSTTGPPPSRRGAPKGAPPPAASLPAGAAAPTPPAGPTLVATAKGVLSEPPYAAGLGTKFHLFSEDTTADTVTLRPFVFRRSALLAKLTSLGFPEGSYHLPALLLCRRAPSLPDLLTTRGPNTQTNIVLPCPDWYSRAMAKEFWVNTSLTIPHWARPFFN